MCANEWHPEIHHTHQTITTEKYSANNNEYILYTKWLKLNELKEL